MIDVGYCPSTSNRDEPRSIQKVLYPPTLPAAPGEPSPPSRRCLPVRVAGRVALEVAIELFPFDLGRSSSVRNAFSPNSSGVERRQSGDVVRAGQVRLSARRARDVLGLGLSNRGRYHARRERDHDSPKQAASAVECSGTLAAAASWRIPPITTSIV